MIPERRPQIIEILRAALQHPFVVNLAIVAPILATTPWTGYDTAPHWERITWSPLSPPVRLRDIAANVALYIPVGYYAAVRFRAITPGRRLKLWLILVLVSVTVEVLQVFNVERFPSTTDVVSNAAGAVFGLGAAARARRTR